MDENGAESTEELHFFYDAQSRPAFVEYDGVMYRYIHNLQGDIVAIVDAAGNLVVEYKYDAWGSPFSTAGSLKTTLGELSPFRYRGYVLDMETELYYLRSRYYNPEATKFVNTDAQIVRAIFKCNSYNYALNSPVVMSDSDGCEATYTVVLNVYGEDYLPDTGHYDISIISETGQNCIFSYNGRSFDTGSAGMTLSFGGMNEDTVVVNGIEIQTSSRIDIYTDPERNVPKEQSYIRIEGLTQTSLDRFMNWFAEAYAVPGEYNKKKRILRCSVFANGHNTYDSGVGPYCGSEAAFLVQAMVHSTYGTRARIAPGVRKIVGFLQEGVKTVGQARSKIQEALKVYVFR